MFEEEYRKKGATILGVDTGGLRWKYICDNLLKKEYGKITQIIDSEDFGLDNVLISRKKVYENVIDAVLVRDFGEVPIDLNDLSKGYILVIKDGIHIEYGINGNKSNAELLVKRIRNIGTIGKENDLKTIVVGFLNYDFYNGFMYKASYS